MFRTECHQLNVGTNGSAFKYNPKHRCHFIYLAVKRVGVREC